MAKKRALIVVAALAGTAAIAATALVIDDHEQRVRADRAQLALTLGGSVSMDAALSSSLSGAFDSLPMPGGASAGLRGMADAPDVVFGAGRIESGPDALPPLDHGEFFLVATPRLPDGWTGDDALAPADDGSMRADPWAMIDSNDPYGIGKRWDESDLLWMLPKTRWVPQRKALMTDSERTDK